MLSGIYEIYDRASGRRYIGASHNIPRRLESHRRRLKRGRHPNRALQDAYTRSGSLAFSVLELVEVKNLSETEQLYLAWFGYEVLFNNPKAKTYAHTLQQNKAAYLRRLSKRLQKLAILKAIRSRYPAFARP